MRLTALTEVPPLQVDVAWQLSLSNNHRPLTTTAPTAVAAGKLAALQPLAEGQTITEQWILTPLGPVSAVEPSPTSSASPPWLRALTGPRRTGAALAAQKAKWAQPLFLATPRVGATAATPEAARGLLSNVTGTFHAANAPGAHFFRRTILNTFVVRSITGRRVPLVVPPCALNTTELAMLLNIPLGEVALPGLRLGTSRVLTPSTDISSTGRVIAESTFGGTTRPLAISVADSLKHLHVIGPTGVGKSTLLINLIVQDMAAGRGVVVVDPKGDLAADVLDRVPPERIGDVIVLDPSDIECPVGFNILAGPEDGRELLVDQVVGTLHNLFKANWGPRTDDILRAALLTLVAEPGMTLCEVPLLLTDEMFRGRLVSAVDDPVALGPFWAWYEGLSASERTAAIGPVLNKLRQFLLRKNLRMVLGQATPNLDLADVLRERKILIVRLAKGLIGEEAAALLGALLIARLWQATMARAGLPAAQRAPFFAYVDEFQDYLHLPTDIADVLAQARGLGLGLTLAHQHLGQLPTPLRDAVLSNARSRVIFQTAAADARLLGREVAPYLTPADLQGLPAYEVYATLASGNRIAPPASGRTVLPPPPTGQAEAALARSRAAYGKDATEVDSAIRARHQGRFNIGFTTPRADADHDRSSGPADLADAPREDDIGRRGVGS